MKRSDAHALTLRVGEKQWYVCRLLRVSVYAQVLYHCNNIEDVAICRDMLNLPGHIQPNIIIRFTDTDWRIARFVSSSDNSSSEGTYQQFAKTKSLAFAQLLFEGSK